MWIKGLETRSGVLRSSVKGKSVENLLGTLEFQVFFIRASNTSPVASVKGKSVGIYLKNWDFGVSTFFFIYLSPSHSTCCPPHFQVHFGEE